MVKANRDLASNVRKGSLGTILMVYKVNPKEYEVEFVDDDNNTLDVLTVAESDISKLDG